MNLLKINFHPLRFKAQLSVMTGLSVCMHVDVFACMLFQGACIRLDIIPKGLFIEFEWNTTMTI